MTKKYSLISNIKYVYNIFFKVNKWLLLWLFIFIVASIVLPIINNYIPALAIDLITNDASIKSFLILMGLITLASLILNFTMTYLSHYLNLMNIYVRVRLFVVNYSKKVMTTDYINVEPHEMQKRAEKASSSMWSNWVGPELLMKNVPPFIINMVGLVAYATIISLFNYWVIIILVLMTIFNVLLTNYAQNYEQKHKDEMAKLSRKQSYLSKSARSLVNGKDVRLYKLENWFYQVFNSLIKQRVKWQAKLHYRYFIPNLSDNIFLLIRDIIAYTVLITMVINKDIDVARFTFLIGMVAGFSTWLNGVVTAYNNLKKANMGVNDYRDYLELDDVYNHGEGLDINTLSKPLTIEFKNVSFRYPNASSDTLHNVNFTIKPGEKIALVGVNGAGKTTLVKLLSGFYKPTSGEILINGNNLNSFNIYDYYQLIGVIFQDIFVLAFNIAQNVACLADEAIDYDRVWDSLALAGLKDKVLSLKNKEKTYLTQSLDKEGILLSGGEMQRLMLARALYKNAPIMVLDEPTAALDPLAESELYEKYNDLTKDKTSIFISHRLASTKFCDKIFFLENGTIIEVGTHQELMQLQQKYAQMFAVQSHYYQQGGESHEEC